MRCLSLIRFLLLTWTFCLCAVVSFSQELPANKQAEVDKCKKMVADFQSQNNKNQIGNYLVKIAYIYWEAQQNQQAIDYFSKALEVNKSNGNKNGVRSICNYIGMIHSDMQQWDNAIKYFDESFRVSKEMKIKENIVSSLSNLAMAYQNKGDYKDAIKCSEQALTLGQELNNMKVVRKSYGVLAECNEKLGNADKAKNFYELYSVFDRKIKDDEMREVQLKSQIAVATAESEKKAKQLELNLKNLQLKEVNDSLSEVEKISRQRQMEIELLSKEKMLKEQQMQMQQKESQLRTERYIRFSLIFVFIIVLIFSIVVLKQYRAKKKAYVELEEKNIQIAHQNDLLERKKEELEARNKKIAEQNTLLERKNQQITDSITYASRIQKAILPSSRAIKANFPESFIFYQPRDIVSGDFYWFTMKDNMIFIAAVDCTGHSVPGAFMSMIGNTLLNEIINEKQIYDPAVVLQKLNMGIIYNLKEQTNEPADDGMDITLCCFDFSTKEIKLACANHSVYVFNDGEYEIIEGDFFSIGEKIRASEESLRFTTHTLPMKEGTTLYMFTDGYSDQFGGPKKSKFLSKQFKKLLYDNQHLNMKQQYDLVYHTFEKWKGDVKQTDDILVIGIRLTDIY